MSRSASSLVALFVALTTVSLSVTAIRLPFQSLLVAGFAVLLIVAASTQGRHPQVPVVLRPGWVLLASAAAASAAALGLPEDELPTYVSLALVQLLAFAAGLVLSAPRAAPMTALSGLSTGQVARAAHVLFVLSICAAGLFVLLRGVPLLQTGVEQARVSAAASGTGYLRLLAYLSVPAALALHALKGRYRYAGVAALVVIALGNRSPLLYLAFPIAVVLVTCRPSVRRPSFQIASAVLVLSAVIVGFGSYRIASQQEFRGYAEYRADFAEGDLVGVAWTSLTQYAEVIPRNALLTKRLADDQALPVAWGSTYATALTTAAPGEQLSLDRKIKDLSGATFIGGGTPPTLMGEGYVNFRYAGVGAGAFFLAVLLSVLAERWSAARASSSAVRDRAAAALYGYAVVWSVLAQVAGLAGGSTFPLVGFVTLVVLLLTTARTGEDAVFEPPRRAQ